MMDYVSISKKMNSVLNPDPVSNKYKTLQGTECQELLRKFIHEMNFNSQGDFNKEQTRSSQQQL